MNIDGLIEDIILLQADAAEYFKGSANDEKVISKLQAQIAQVETACQHNSMLMFDWADSLKSLITHLENGLARQEKRRLQRLKNAITVCSKLLALTEGHDRDATWQKSATFFHSILSVSQSTEHVEGCQKIKPIYKGILSLRLLDTLMSKGLLKFHYLRKYYNEALRYGGNNDFQTGYQHTVILPVMLAALFQDIGLQHPTLKDMVHHEDDRTGERLLEPDERKILLANNFLFTKDYLLFGLGARVATGLTRIASTAFDMREKTQVQFRTAIIKDATTPKLGIGDLIKIPQVYTSLVLPSVHSEANNSAHKELPKIPILINRWVDKSKLNQQITNIFIGKVCNMKTIFRMQDMATPCNKKDFSIGTRVYFLKEIAANGESESEYKSGVICSLCAIDVSVDDDYFYYVMVDFTEHDIAGADD